MSLGEEDDEDDLQDDEERHVRRAPPVREVEHAELCLEYPVESWSTPFSSSTTTTKRPYELYDGFCKLSWVLLVCLGSMAQGSKARASVELWEKSFQISLYSSLCLFVYHASLCNKSMAITTAIIVNI